MAEKSHDAGSAKAVEPSLNPIPVPSNPETMPEKLPSSPEEGIEKLEKKQTNKSDIPEPEYPSTAKVIPIVAALYMTFFLVALVGQPFHPLSSNPRLTMI